VQFQRGRSETADFDGVTTGRDCAFLREECSTWNNSSRGHKMFHVEQFVCLSRAGRILNCQTRRSGTLGALAGGKMFHVEQLCYNT